MPAPDHPPAFQFYPDAFANDGKVEAMSTEEVGAYILLICKAWRECPPGSIPDDDRVLARWSRLTPDRWSECRTGVLAAFTLGKDGRWHQKRLRREFQKLMEYREKARESGHAGAEKRWGAHRQAMAPPMGSDSTSTLSLDQKYQTREGEPWDIEDRVRAWVGDVLGGNERAALLRHWRAAQESDPVEIHGQSVEMTSLVRVCVEETIRSGFKYAAMPGFLKYVSSMQTRCRRQKCWPHEGLERKPRQPQTPRLMEGAH